MVKKYLFGLPFETGAVVADCCVGESLSHFEVSLNDGVVFSCKLGDSDAVYGLGEAARGINKRGYIYDSYCNDDPNHTEVTRSLYGAHNFILIDGEVKFGAFFDYPTRLVFDIGYTHADELTVSAATEDITVYIIEGNSALDIVREFRTLIGTSYIPPLWAFGYQQSRWSYHTRERVEMVADKYRSLSIPLDAVYLDIDYMEKYKDFTVDDKAFPDFEGLVADMKKKGIRLVPIIDAGVKIEKDYEVYEQGVENGYFCTDENGEPYALGVWPGLTHFPDFFNPEAGRWFGEKYRILTDMGIEGFWNDMNEPAIFYSQKGLDRLFDKVRESYGKEDNVQTYYDLREIVNSLHNSQDDYNSFYHKVGDRRIRHNDVHNLYGYYMTKCTSQALTDISPDKRILLFSRASYIGMHRYGGIWTGDNHSWWSHLLLELHQLPSLNMCGFLYSGADIGGFGCNCTRDLLLRWLALGVFTPLMRNHAANGTRDQECYQFENPEDFKSIIELRYRLIPYIYSEYMKAAINGDMLFKPLAFVYPDDETGRHTEDQLMLANELMIAPVYTQNAIGRYVYLPEDMTEVRCKSGELVQTPMKKGHHFVFVALNEVVFYIRNGKAIPMCESALSTEYLDMDKLTLIGNGSSYELYSDDGISLSFGSESCYRRISRGDTH